CPRPTASPFRDRTPERWLLTIGKVRMSWFPAMAPPRFNSTILLMKPREWCSCPLIRWAGCACFGQFLRRTSLCLRLPKQTCRRWCIPDPDSGDFCPQERAPGTRGSHRRIATCDLLLAGELRRAPSLSPPRCRYQCGTESDDCPRSPGAAQRCCDLGVLHRT